MFDKKSKYKFLDFSIFCVKIVQIFQFCTHHTAQPPPIGVHIRWETGLSRYFPWAQPPSPAARCDRLQSGTPSAAPCKVSPSDSIRTRI